MTALIKAHDNPILLNLDCAARLYELAIELFGRSVFKASRLFGEPTIATIGQNSRDRKKAGEIIEKPLYQEDRNNFA